VTDFWSSMRARTFGILRLPGEQPAEKVATGTHIGESGLISESIRPSSPQWGIMDGLTALDIFETIRNPVLVLDPDLRVVFADRAFLRTFRVGNEEMLGRRVYELGDGQWDIARLRQLLHEIIPTNPVVEDFEVEAGVPALGGGSRPSSDRCGTCWPMLARSYLTSPNE
jgi:PAS domain-containing protein